MRRTRQGCYVSPWKHISGVDDSKSSGSNNLPHIAPLPGCGSITNSGL